MKNRLHTGLRRIAVAAHFLTAQLAMAADQVVTDPGDNGGANQLRAKLAAAQSSGGGTITFATGPATIVLTSALPTISATVTIDGGGNVSISGANSFRIFVTTGTVTLRNLTLTNAFSSSNDGGAIFNQGTLTIDQCKFLGNQTGASWSGGAVVTYGPLAITNTEFAFNKGGGGGAVYPRFGNAVTTITGCNFHDNEAMNTLGGAILLWDGAKATVHDTTFANNTARTAGGAVFGQGPSAFLPNDCVFTANKVTDTFGDGGAVYLQGSGEIRGCTFTNNNGSRGGALFVASGTTLVSLSTFDTNWAAYGGAARVDGGTLDLNQVVMNRNGYAANGTKVTTGGGALSQGGGLISANNVTISNSWASYGAAFYRDSSSANANADFTNVTISGGASVGSGAIDMASGSLTTTNVTITNNQASFFAAGISVRGGTYSTRNTILAKNIGRPNLERSNSGTVVSNGFNLCDDDSGAGLLTANSDKVGAQFDPRLAPLSANGGFTLTHLPQAGSPAIDNGTGSGAPGKDQRGVTRPQGAGFDIGAVEIQPSDLPRLANISTRLRVETGDNVMIGGFIVTGTQPKKVIIRAIGPSLPLAGRLENPTLELYQGSTLLASNDDWQNQPAADRQAVIDSTIAPSDNLEAALVRTLPANNASYTAIVRGASDGTGIGVVEAYDLDRSVDSKLANISTRGFVQTGDNVLIAGTIILGLQSQKVIVRAIGPSLPISGKLGDPTLELRDSNGTLVEANDNWVDSPNKPAIIDTTIAPANDVESAIVRLLAPAAYTAIVRGVNDTTGIAVVEVYALN